jgi:transposase, IS30 family
MGYHHLTEEERYQIYEYRCEGLSHTSIAMRLRRHASTISRELRRNSGERGYRPKQANEKAMEKRLISTGNAPRIEPERWLVVEERLRLDHSPEQIAGTLKDAPSHESIYWHIYADKASGGDLHKHLRCQKARRKRYGSGQERRGQLRNRRDIADRPAIVDRKTRVGDWEHDCVLGDQRPPAIVTMVERKTQYVVLAKVERRTADTVRDAIVSKLLHLKPLVHTMTYDNGHEFAEHEAIASSLSADCFFAKPYCSWQRGLNEQVNGLIRQYIPKGKSLDSVTDETLDFVMSRLNHRPRKTLGYKTPHQLMSAEAKKRGVALRS